MVHVLIKQNKVLTKTKAQKRYQTLRVFKLIISLHLILFVQVHLKHEFVHEKPIPYKKKKQS